MVASPTNGIDRCMRQAARRSRVVTHFGVRTPLSYPGHFEHAEEVAGPGSQAKHTCSSFDKRLALGSAFPSLLDFHRNLNFDVTSTQIPIIATKYTL